MLQEALWNIAEGGVGEYLNGSRDFRKMSLTIPHGYENIVLSYIDRFREELRMLYRAHKARELDSDMDPKPTEQGPDIVNLTSLVQMGGNKSVELEFIASRLFCSYGSDPSRTRIVLPPFIIPYFSALFDPLDVFMKAIEHTPRLALHYPRSFEAILLKWFQSVFSSGAPLGGSAGTRLDVYLPLTSKLASVEFEFPEEPPLIDFPKVLGPSFESTVDPERNLTIAGAARRLMNCIEQGESPTCLIPAEFSRSPDGFIVTKKTLMDGSRVLIAVTAKLYTVTPLQSIQAEGGKFLDILQQIPNVSGFLFVIATGQSDMADDSGTAQMIASGSNMMEVILINLRTPRHREMFWKRAANDIHEILERKLLKRE
jgi:hypothetical protein